MKRTSITILLIGLMITACSSTGPRKIILDQSSNNKPAWTNSNKLAWQEEDHIYLRAIHTIKNNERINGCMDLAKLDAKENLISEIKNDIKGSIDNAQQSINVDAEVVLGKVRSSEFQGSISGLRFVEFYWEKYQMGNDEQVTTCHVLSQIKEKDYVKTKKAVLNNVIAIEPRIKEAISRKQIDFFRERSPSQEN